MKILRLVVIGLMVCTVLAIGVAMGRRDDATGQRERADKLFTQGNFKDAYEIYRALALDPHAGGRSGRPRPGAGGRVPGASGANRRGRRVSRGGDRSSSGELATAGRRRPRAISTIRNTSARSSPGSFTGDISRVTGATSVRYERDRSRALQLLVKGLDQAQADPDRGAAGAIS